MERWLESPFLKILSFKKVEMIQKDISIINEMCGVPESLKGQQIFCKYLTCCQTGGNKRGAKTCINCH